MEIDFLQARHRMYDEYKTLSGIDGGELVGGYFEMYREAFFDALDAHGRLAPEPLAAILRQANTFDSVGDFLAKPKDQLNELAAFGLVLLDRIALTGWGRFDFERCFMLHEQIFECFEYVRDASKMVDRARRYAAERHKTNREARKYVVAEWQARSKDYDGNKSEFARHYVGLVRNKFLGSNGDPFIVTVKTIRDVWLSDTPSASNRAG